MDNCFGYDSLMASGSDHVVHFRWVRSYSAGDCNHCGTYQDNPGKETAQMTTYR